MTEKTTASGAQAPCISLLACPFCGSPAKFDEPVDAIVGEKVVVCTGCRIRTYPGPEYRVVMAWNRRQANARLDRQEEAR
jgi:hypothetical protein